MATFTVTNLIDLPVTGAGNAPGTLRQAVYDANHSDGTDEIVFAGNLSGRLELAVANDSFWGASALVITSPITIRGNSNGITLGRAATAGEMRIFHVTSGGNLTLDSISVTDGIARGSTGTQPGEDGGEARGGAIYNEGWLHIVASTFYANQAIGGNAGAGGAAGSGRGGAIYNAHGQLTISNSTFSANSAQRGAGTNVSSFGGGVYSLNGIIQLRNSTLADNTAGAGRGLYVLPESGTTYVDIISTIISERAAPSTKTDLIIAPDAGGQLNVTGSNNLIGFQNDFNFITVASADPMLGSLANNGGPTWTHALLNESPAINSGVNPLGLSTDQRSAFYSRVAGVAADIGAFELQSITSPALLGDYNLNQTVDAADFVLWRNSIGTSVEQYAGADGNGNSSVDVGDYGVWRARFATAPSAAGAAITEFPTPQEAYFAAGDRARCCGSRIGFIRGITADRPAGDDVAVAAWHDAALLTLLAAEAPARASDVSQGGHEDDDATQDAHERNCERIALNAEQRLTQSHRRTASSFAASIYKA